jgi:hypothetical protein
MKKGFLIAAILILQYSAFSQGAVIFNLPDAPILSPLDSPVFNLPGVTFFDAQGTPILISQGTFIILPGSGGSGSSYATGTDLTPPSGVTGTATDIRARSFSGSGYFTSGDQSLDTSFALRLGNGVDLRAASSAGTQIVPEPSATSLATLGAVVVFLWRAFRAYLKNRSVPAIPVAAGFLACQ